MIIYILSKVIWRIIQKKDRFSFESSDFIFFFMHEGRNYSKHRFPENLWNDNNKILLLYIISIFNPFPWITKIFTTKNSKNSKN